MKPTRFLLAFVMTLALALAGCTDDCGEIYCDCGPAVTFHVFEAGTGNRISDVNFTTNQNDLLGKGCAADEADGGVCMVGAYVGAGTVSFQFFAAGHGTVSKTVTVPAAGGGCCACPFVAEPIDIALPRL